MTLFIAILALVGAWLALIGLIILALHVAHLRVFIDDLIEAYVFADPLSGDLGDPITTAQAGLVWTLREHGPGGPKPGESGDPITTAQAGLDGAQVCGAPDRAGETVCLLPAGHPGSHDNPIHRWDMRAAIAQAFMSEEDKPIDLPPLGAHMIIGPDGIPYGPFYTPPF